MFAASALEADVSFHSPVARRGANAGRIRHTFASVFKKKARVEFVEDNADAEECG